jgi:hypothetical protein
LPRFNGKSRDIAREFRRAASQLANRLSVSGEGRKRHKNRELAKNLCRIISSLEYEIFSRLDPFDEPKKAYELRNLIFGLDTSGYQEGYSVHINKPIRKISLPTHAITAASYIPLSDTAYICLPISSQTMVKGIGKKLMKAMQQGNRSSGKAGTEKRLHRLNALAGSESIDEMRSYRPVVLGGANRHPARHQVERQEGLKQPHRTNEHLSGRPKGIYVARAH